MINSFRKLRDKMSLNSQIRSQKKADIMLKELQLRTCNKHSDCDMADEEAKADGKWRAEHCHDECCEDCFGQ